MPGRKCLLEERHECHPGIVHMQALVRSYLWWPGLDRDIELKVRSCQTCREHSKLPANANLHPWEWPGKAWYRLHIDYMGPFEGNMILFIVDAYSKYTDAHVMTSATTAATILQLRQTFSTHGLPCTIVSDNGSPFTSQEFQQYCSMNGIKHIRSSPYHPANKGLAERAVQTIKTRTEEDGRRSRNKDVRILRTLSNHPSHENRRIARADVDVKDTEIQA